MTDATTAAVTLSKSLIYLYSLISIERAERAERASESMLPIRQHSPAATLLRATLMV